MFAGNPQTINGKSQSTNKWTLIGFLGLFVHQLVWENFFFKCGMYKEWKMWTFIFFDLEKRFTPNFARTRPQFVGRSTRLNPQRFYLRKEHHCQVKQIQRHPFIG